MKQKQTDVKQLLALPVREKKQIGYGDYCTPVSAPLAKQQYVQNYHFRSKNNVYRFTQKKWDSTHVTHYDSAQDKESGPQTNETQK